MGTPQEKIIDSDLNQSSSGEISVSQGMVKKRRLQDWLMDKANSPWATHILVLVAFAESSILPTPPDLMLIPMIIANRLRAFYLAALSAASSVLGGLVGYLLGFFLIDTAGRFIIQTYGLETEFINFQEAFQNYGFWLIVFKGVTPIPFKLVTIASGATHLNIWLFLVASTISRSVRFFLLATVLWYYGDEAKEYYENHFKTFMILSFAVIIGGFLFLKFFK